MTRYVQVDNGVVTGELFTTGSFDLETMPEGRTMIDATDRADLQIGALVTFLKVPSSSVVFADGSLQVSIAPILEIVPPLSSLEETVNRIALKIGA
jgi:hypothetical protein